MRYTGFALFCAAVSLAACSGHVSTGPQTDQTYDTAMDVGRSAFDLAHPDQARGQFEAAYGRALLRDDAVAVRDAGYNLAIADLAADDPAAVLATVARTKRDMALRGQAPTPALDTVAMAALYRQGRNAQTLDLGRQIRTDDAALQERIAFFAGLASDGLGDTGGIERALVALPLAGKLGAMEQADRAELDSRLNVRQGLWAQGEKRALAAVSLRRDMLDYRGMARALDCASRAAQGAGQPERAAAYAARAVESRSHTEKQNRASSVLHPDGGIADVKGAT